MNKFKIKPEVQNKDIKIDENIAYFIGVLHSDACIYVFEDKTQNRQVIRLSLQIGDKSIPMAYKFKQIFFDYFGRTVNLRKIPNKPGHSIQTSINRIRHIIVPWDNYKIPLEIKKTKSLFGAYLAGLVDGDGYIKSKKNQKDRILPQCVVRIASDRPLGVIKRLIEHHLDCRVHFEYSKNSKCVHTCFYISKNNSAFITKYISPHLTIPHKIEALRSFLMMKNEPVGI